MWHELRSQVGNLYVFRSLFGFKQFAGRLADHPLSINLLITSQCNLKCKICSVQKMLQEKNEMDTGQLLNFINEIARLNPAIFISGGEPFMRKDIFTILDALKKKGLPYGIVTNGTMLNEAKIDKLVGLEPKVVIFSIYGNEFLHKKMVGKEDAFRILNRNVSLMNKKRKKIRLLLNCVINQENFNFLEDIVKQGKMMGVDMVRFEHLIFLRPEEYKAHLKSCSRYYPEDLCRLTTYIADIDNERIGDILKKTIPNLRKKYGSFVLFKPYLSKRELSLWYKKNFSLSRKCFFIKHSIFIKPNGDVVPCQFFSNFILGNIANDNFLKIWKSKKRKKFNRIFEKSLLPGCMRCCKL